MLKISKNNAISICQGDTDSLTLNIKNYTLKSGDKLILTVKKHTNSADIVLQKQVEDVGKTSVTITFVGDDTKNIPFGKYVYDIRFKDGSGNYDTVKTVGEFNILEVVGRNG